jgi:PAS domain S-box-containing protein
VDDKESKLATAGAESAQAVLCAVLPAHPELGAFLIESVFDGLWIEELCPGGRTWMSPRLPEFLGFEPHEVNNPVAWRRALLLSEDALLHEAAVARHLADPRCSVDHVLRFRHKDGHLVWLRCRALALRDEVGKPCWLFAFQTDVTALKRAEERVALLQEATQAGFIEHNLPISELMVSARWAAIIGYEVSELPPGAEFDNWIRRLLHPDDQPRVTQLQQRFSRGELPSLELTMRLRHKQGHWIDVQWHSVASARDDRGMLTRVKSAMVDITDRTRQQHRLMQSERMATVGAMSASIAHEVNNPLAAVTANLEFLVGQLTPLVVGGSVELREVAGVLCETRDAAARISKIVRGLKVFSRSEDAHPTLLDVHSVLDVALSLSRNEIRHRAQLRRKYGLVPPVVADESRLVQVFVNLLINAAQSIPDGALDDNEICVETNLEADGSVRIRVLDTGGGISDSIRDRIFEPFFSTKPVGTGSGLGLAISRSIVDGLGGTLACEQRPGGGTVFTVVLPAGEGEIAEVAPPSAVSTSAIRRGKVLIIDDEPDVAAAVRRVLRRDHEVEILSDARDALTLLAAGQAWDVILCDLMMPQMSGMVFFDELRRRFPLQATKVLFMSGGVFSGEGKSFLDRVANPRLEKPFAPERLKEMVAAMIV